MSTPAAQPQSIDWGLGQYETTAAELEPAAAHVVSLAGVMAGERVLDIATGTGNGALAAARAGARAAGIDAAPRLVEVARQRAASDRLEIAFEVGDLHELPFASGSFDCAISVFGIIFAADPVRAAAELVRVLAPGGRGLISVWVPAGPIDAMVGVFMPAPSRRQPARGHPASHGTTNSRSSSCSRRTTSSRAGMRERYRSPPTHPRSISTGSDPTR